MKNRTKSKNHFRNLLLCMTILWMTGIFLMSAQPADESTNTSLFVGRTIASLTVEGYSDRSPEEQLKLAEMIDHPVRKTAHILEYTILGILISLTLNEYRRASYESSMAIAFILGAAYAATDEFHQLFVPGRSGQISDVALDSAGVLAGCFIVYVLKKIIETGFARKRVSVP